MMAKAAKAKKLAKVKSLWDLKQKAKVDERYKKIAAAAVDNIAADGLRGKGPDEFENDVQALNSYLMSMVGEYGQSEDEAEEMLVDEINFVRDLV